ncbi:MAG: endopeptidase La [bacterium]
MSSGDIIQPVGNPEGKMIPDVLPLFLTRDLVIFPGLIVPMAISDQDTIKMIDSVMAQGSRILGAFLVKPDATEIKPEFAMKIGSAIIIHRLLRPGDGTIRMIVQGLERVELLEVVGRDPFPKGRVQVLTPKVRNSLQLEALVRTVREEFDKVAQLSDAIPDEFRAAVMNLDDPGALCDLIASNIQLDTTTRQQVLQTIRIPDRLRLLRNLLARELQILKLGSELKSETREEIAQTQREYFLRQQLRKIQEELGDADEEGAEAREWRERVEEANLPERVLEVAEKELERLERINPASAEYSVVTTYLDWLVSLPWAKTSEDNLDLKRAETILNEDHYGLEDIKERILEMLAVRKLKKDAGGPILCFVGPPGVGKTSLGQSIARSMNREFIRISLGGMRDEAEIRGHRRTYVGALPGRILQSIKKAGTRNPVFMLDEVDKLVSDFRGDPSSALLEVLDPAQNKSFSDHYIEIDFDLSAVFFITTANYLEAIPPPLRDRMEIIRLPGYIGEEKVEIARQYLVPRQIEANGLLKKHIRFDKAVIDEMITYYTREAGVRNLERTIGTVCRKVARKVAVNPRTKPVRVTTANIRNYLGPRKITPSWVNRKAAVGITTGLAYTPYGGDTLPIETVLMPGKGQMKITGQLGDVMKESAQIAISWIRANQKMLRIEGKLFTNRDLHIHVPEGATPKDGPSAGVTMATSLASIYSGRKVRADLAMTGEITLEGRVLPIGGLREKVVAANRARIKHVIIPEDNRQDLQKIPKYICKRINFHPVTTVNQVLELALIGKGKAGRASKGSKSKRTRSKITSTSIASTKRKAASPKKRG